MTPNEIYTAIKEALKATSHRQFNLSTTAGWRGYYAAQQAALAAVGVNPTRIQIVRMNTMEMIRTLWDQTEYIMARHYGRRGKVVRYPVRHGDGITVHDRPKRVPSAAPAKPRTRRDPPGWLDPTPAAKRTRP